MQSKAEQTDPQKDIDAFNTTKYPFGSFFSTFLNLHCFCVVLPVMSMVVAGVVYADNRPLHLKQDICEKFHRYILGSSGLYMTFVANLCICINEQLDHRRIVWQLVVCE